MAWNGRTMIQGALAAAGVALALTGMRQVFGSDAADSAMRSRRLVGELRPVAFGTGSVNVAELHRRGWLECDGRTLHQSDFPELYGALRDTWGKANDGDFRLPDLRQVALKGIPTDWKQDQQKELLGADYVVGRPGGHAAKTRPERAAVTYFIYAGREAAAPVSRG